MDIVPYSFPQSIQWMRTVQFFGLQSFSGEVRSWYHKLHLFYQPRFRIEIDVMFFVTQSAYRNSFTLSDVMTTVGKSHYHRVEFLDNVCCWYRDAIGRYVARGYLTARAHPFTEEPTIVYVWNTDRALILRQILTRWLLSYAKIGMNEDQLVQDWICYYRRLFDKRTLPVLPLASLLISYDARLCPNVDDTMLDPTYCPNCNLDRLFDCKCLPIVSSELVRALTDESWTKYVVQAAERDMIDGTQQPLTPLSLSSQNGN